MIVWVSGLSFLSSSSICKLAEFVGVYSYEIPIEINTNFCILFRRKGVDAIILADETGLISANKRNPPSHTLQIIMV